MTVDQEFSRLEDHRLAVGRGRFHESVRRADLAHLRVVRSAVAHGRLDGVDVAEAAAVPGVLGVFTAADLPDGPPIPARQPSPGIDFTPYLQPPLAREWVRHVGEPVAFVVAEDAYVAEDAARLVDVAISELPPVLDARRADGTTVESLAGVPARVGTIDTGYGDVAGAFDQAATVVELELDTGRHSAMPLENRGLTVGFDHDTERLVVWGAAKVPFWNRNVIARYLGVPDDRLHMRESDVGGSFGIRGELYAEDLLTVWAASRLRRTIRWVEDREEHLLAANHARQQHHRVRAAFTPEGRMTALDDEAWLDTGAYIRTHGAVVAALTAGMFAGPYRVPAFRSQVHLVVTNKMGVGTYRAPGRFQNNAAREHLMDLAASRLGLSPEEVRLRNLPTGEETPDARPMRIFGAPMLLDGGDHHGHVTKALATVGWDTWTARAGRARSEGRAVGVGMAAILEKAGLGHENAVVSVDTSGGVRVAVGSTSVGQGAETVLAIAAAEVLGVPPQAVRVVLSDTDTLHDGGGTFASRTTVVAGTAVHQAAEQVRDRAARTAARILQAEPEDVVVRDGFAASRHAPKRQLPLGALAQAAAAPGFLRPGEEPGLIARSTFSAPTMTYPPGVHFAEVEVDTDIGEVRVTRYAVTYEIGRTMHEGMARGQVTGGVAQGIGGALYEDLPYDADGVPLVRSQRDYRVPLARDLPDIEVHLFEDVPAPGNPLGVRGVGEAGIAGAGAAVMNAVRDALQLTAPLPRLPLTQATVLRAIRDRDAPAR
ncbi:xanthine dehydrogenase family protein molybdopterin-binding subunit [Myceligenerans indicum]|uniref:Xanthine dehydrogenase family protein molybdopterin-binding subunit n=1 Tax=Myceligenerans indicum TaxID=2593663 RepID=A0ABS1LPZ8_9MICO|nr:xanthine dehydrogenase family protein molybdopterin-binding subunit [Myceligenerans indicum]MBL0888356.1 xanthine dehydrogenase family protein molybdopterin-binding subunit [Myceligenerans indicum]